MTQSEIEQKAEQHANWHWPSDGRNFDPLKRSFTKQDFISGAEFVNADSQNQIDKLTECLRELVTAEWMVTHDWGGDRDAILTKARTLLATFTDKKSEDEKENPLP